jgi:cytochrome c oxidase subunit 4
MAKHSTGQADVTAMHHQHVYPTPRKYVQIGLILLFVTVFEVAASFLTDLGFPGWVQVAVLLVLSFVKGSLVVLFYMHLRFDSRWFSSLFVGGIMLAAFMIITLILLFSYHARVAG